MLGSLARKLRALGFDAAYYGSGDDSGVLRLAAREGRVLLTADRDLARRASVCGQRAFLLSGANDGARLREIVESALAAGVKLRRGPPLCSLCGGSLARIERGVASALVPPAVARRHRFFLRCASCGQVYWKGSHWKKLRSMARRLPAK